MGKLMNDDGIPKKYNIEKLLEDKTISKEICRITYDQVKNNSGKAEIKEKVDQYYRATHDMTSDKDQCGRVWFLVKVQDDFSEVLQVAQAIDYDCRQSKGFFNEIYCHIDEIFDDKEKTIYHQFAGELKDNGMLIFYELDIESYLSQFAPSNYKELIYRMAREYFAEASIAYFTQSREWRFYNSGMDKRALYYLYANVKAKKIDEQ